MPRIDKVGTKATKVYTVDGITKVRYHNTDVVEFGNERITLRTDGWHTYTTKTRMNQASNQFGLGFYVWQKNFKWFVDFQGETSPFEENMVLER